MGKKLVFRCVGCKGEVRCPGLSIDSWGHGSHVMGLAGWRILYVAVSDRRRAWGLYCAECTAANLAFEHSSLCVMPPLIGMDAEG